MPFKMTEMVGCEFPLFAFSHCRDVVAAVSRAGGFGVLGGSSFTPQSLEEELRWIDDHVDGKAYGVDILTPQKLDVDRSSTTEQLAEAIPTHFVDFIANLLSESGIAFRKEELISPRPPLSLMGEELMDVAFSHPIRLIANALGIAPPSMIERGRRHGVPVAALVGTREHAIKQVNAGVDIVVAQGAEAGGHCGEVSTLVLVDEVIRAVKPLRDVPVLAAGGIVSGRQMAGCMTMGAAGAWTGTVWLATVESEVSPVIREKMIEASSRDTIRSKARTGKFSRQLRSAWHDAWEGPDGPGDLTYPLMGMLSRPAFAYITRAAEAGNPKARALQSYWVGQGVGMIDKIQSAGGVVQEFKKEFAEAVEEFMGNLE